jgi:cysteine desulfurase
MTLQRIYFDNAATTPIDPKVWETMQPLFLDYYGNPSSIHTHGRKVKGVIEQSRKTIASLLNVSPAEITFTSGGTEADNIVLRLAVKELGVKHIISSPIEHHAVLNTILDLQECDGTKAHFLKIDHQGNINIDELDNLLSSLKGQKVLVSLMHANNEIGTLYDINEIGYICRKHQALFHSDTVQTMGHYEMDLSKLPVDYVVASAHKFNGPKGVGFYYARKTSKLNGSLITGGGQERGYRAGTENIYGIVGLAKALEISINELETKQRRIQNIKEKAIAMLKSNFEGISINGNTENSLYTVLNVSFPSIMASELFLFQLDIHGISVSGGSACSSGAAKGSHVLEAIKADESKNHVRFSFGKFNTTEEVDYLIEQLNRIFEKVKQVQ